MQIYDYQPKSKGDKPSKKWKLKKPDLKKMKAKKILIWLFRIFACGVLLTAFMFLYYTKDLPDPNKLLSRDVPESTKIFARDGSLLYEIHGEIKRTLVNLDQISPYVAKATVAVEDKDFYHHNGIYVRGILRSVWADITKGKAVQGGSTITQQFVKNAILTKDKTFDRKAREIILAVAIDAKFSKDEILKLYLNEIPYGRNAYGIEAAAQSYFNKSAKDLDLAESAYLAAMPQSTTYYNPMGPHRDALDNRKNTILALMQQQGYITAEQQKQASEEKVAFVGVTNNINAPHFVFYVQDYLASKYGEKTLEEGGLKVYTTLDPKLQKIAEDVVKADVEKTSKKYNANNAALVAIDPNTRQILAMVGSKDYFGKPEPAGCTPGKNCLFEPNVNVATAQRQPGSSFKPYAYVTAFKPDFKYSPATMLMDVVTNFGTFGGKAYIPHDYDNGERGPVSMRKALAGSLNIPAVKTLALVGVDNVTKTAHDLGITSPLSDCGLSLVLGGCEVRLLDHVAAYSTLANEGIKNEKTPILKIEDKDGKTLEEFKSNPQEVVDPQSVYELISIMTDNNARSYIFGAKSPLILSDRTVAAKTGTTQNWHDGWTMGFTPSLAAGVWAGNNDGTLLKKGADGVFVAAPIWHDFMQQALAGTPAEDFKVPDGIKKVVVDEVSGKLPTDLTPSTKTETFASFSVPTQYDDVHISVPIDSATGQPADSLTPPDRIVNQPYTVFHSEKKTDPNWENAVIAWATAAGYSYPSSEGFVPPASTGNGPTVNIVSPVEDAVINKIPFQVSVAASSNKSIARIDLSIDGQFVKSISMPPYTFEVNNNYNDGQHTIAIHAVDSDGGTADTSVVVTFALNAPLTLTQPTSGAQIDFPYTLTAKSLNSFDQVNFYYQDSSGAAKLIGVGTSTYTGDGFEYTITWTDSPPKGTYKVYAQASTGTATQKVKVTVK